MGNRAWIVVASLITAACSPPANTADTGATDSSVDVADAASDVSSDRALDAPSEAAATCANDNDCSDSVYCNGAERCMPGAAGADSRGCAAASPANPCAAGQTCDEAMDRCLSPCDSMADVDGDGHRAMNCGGDDCDDADANRFPGHAEVCDSTGHDEDCDTLTFGVRDDDHDGSPDMRCCNTDSTGMHCGRDCDDSSASVNPSAPEVCNGVDDNCVGGIDEGVMVAFYRDGDNDMYGDPMSTPMMGCSRPSGYADNNGDCDDANASRNPGAPEVCDGVDNNCNTTVDDGLPTNMCYRDRDNDLYGSMTESVTTCGACPAGYTNNASEFDCYDTDARVHPGQTMYFVAGTTAADGLQYDFDCNGVEEREYPISDVCNVSPIFCGPVWLSTSSTVCGTYGQLQSCVRMMIGSTSSCVSTGTPVRTQVACR